MQKNKNPEEEYKNEMAARGLEQITNKGSVPKAPEPIVGDEHKRRVDETALEQAKEGGPQAPETLTGQTLENKTVNKAMEQLKEQLGKQEGATGIPVGDKGIKVENWPVEGSNVSAQQEVKPGSAEEQG